MIARRTGKDVNSHTVLDGIITTIMATIQRINIIGSREGSRNRRRLKANQTGKKFRVGIKSNISTNRNNLISGVDRCIHLNAMKKDRKSGSAGMPRPISYAVFCLKKKNRKIPSRDDAEYTDRLVKQGKPPSGAARWNDAPIRQLAIFGKPFAQ